MLFDGAAHNMGLQRAGVAYLHSMKVLHPIWVPHLLFDDFA